MDNKPLQWHPAFQAILQIELTEDREYLQFYKEYNLTDKPLRIDTLVIKVEPGRKIKKNIGQIFRQYNVLEYKGPTDYIGINSFYKSMGYACVLQSSTKRELEIPPDELTITLVGNRYPRKLLRYLKKRYPVTVTNPFPGIYYVAGLLFPVQILVQHQLSGSENIWLSRLRFNLKPEENVEILTKEYKGRDQDPLYSAAMDVIVRANWKIYEEEGKVCDALNELFEARLEKKEVEWKAKGIAEGKAEGIAEGKAEAILELLMDLGTVSDALRTQILAQKDMQMLSKWLKLAAQAGNVETFIRNMKV